MFRVLPRILPQTLFQFKFFPGKPFVVSSIFSFFLYNQYKSQNKSVPKFVSSSESIGLTLFSKSNDQPLASGFFLNKDGVFITLLNVLPLQDPQKINSNEFYIKHWANPLISYEIVIDYVLPEENLAFGHILRTDQEEKNKLKKIDFSLPESCEIGSKGYLFSKTQNMRNLIERGYILDKTSGTSMNFHSSDPTIYGSPIMTKEGKILGILLPPSEENHEYSSNIIESHFLKPICEQYLERNEIKKAYLGLSVKNSQTGITVIKINSGGPASVAGVKLGDVIKEVNGRKIEGPAEFSKMVGYGKEERISLKVLRNGMIYDIDLTSV